MKAARVMGLAINMKKTKYMKGKRKSTNTKMLKTEYQEYEKVKGFKCLGTVLKQDNDIKLTN